VPPPTAQWYTVGVAGTKVIGEDAPFLPASRSFGNWVKTLPVWADGDGAACLIFLVDSIAPSACWFCSTMVTSVDVTFLFEGVVEASLPPCIHTFSRLSRRIYSLLCLCALCSSLQWPVLRWFDLPLSFGSQRMLCRYRFFQDGCLVVFGFSGRWFPAYVALTSSLAGCC
jgi:hypothetical protein